MSTAQQQQKKFIKKKNHECLNVVSGLCVRISVYFLLIAEVQRSQTSLDVKPFKYNYYSLSVEKRYGKNDFHRPPDPVVIKNMLNGEN